MRVLPLAPACAARSRTCRVGIVEQPAVGRGQDRRRGLLRARTSRKRAHSSGNTRPIARVIHSTSRRGRPDVHEDHLAHPFRVRLPVRSPSVVPHDPPHTSHRSMPRCSRIRSQSAIRCGRRVGRQVDLRLARVRRAAPAVALVELHDPVRAGSNHASEAGGAARARPAVEHHRRLAVGIAADLPVRRWPSPTSSMPASYGSIAGYRFIRRACQHSRAAASYAPRRGARRLPRLGDRAGLRRWSVQPARSGATVDAARPHRPGRRRIVGLMRRGRRRAEPSTVPPGSPPAHTVTASTPAGTAPAQRRRRRPPGRIPRQ